MKVNKISLLILTCVVGISTVLGIAHAQTTNENWCSLWSEAQIQIQKPFLSHRNLVCHASKVDAPYVCSTNQPFLSQQVTLYQNACQNPPKTSKQEKLIELQQEILGVLYNRPLIVGLGANTVINNQLLILQTQISDLQQAK